MLEKVRFCVLASTWHQARDRFMPDTNERHYTPIELIHLAAEVEGITGIELIYPQQVNFDNLEAIKEALKETGLVTSTVAASISSKPCFRAGSLIADQPDVRQKAIETVKQAMDIAAALKTDRANVWLGRDGFDYPFQIDYDQAWGRIVEAFREIGEYRSDIRVGIGYKIREPRRWLLVNTAAKTLVLADQVGLPNIGVLVDNGHTIWGYESMAEVVSLSARHDRLFHVHFNDNTRYFDDDMVIGSVHLLELIEMLYWLDRVGYDGWISFDPHIYIEDGTRVVDECMRYTRGMVNVLEKIGHQAVEEAIASRQVTEIMAMVRHQIFASG